MAKKMTNATPQTSSADEQPKTALPPDIQQDTDTGPPYEHFRGERMNEHSEAGDVDAETLDQNAPYNKTYGRKHDR